MTCIITENVPVFDMLKLVLNYARLFLKTIISITSKLPSYVHILDLRLTKPLNIVRKTAFIGKNVSEPATDK